MEATADTETARRSTRVKLVESVVGFGIALSVGLSLWWRSSLLNDLPLWLDESWTAVLSLAPTLQSFIHQMRLDSNAPLYYFLIWLWPFESDFGLRVPSALFVVGASILAALWSPLERRRALFWAALLFLWIPAASLFIDARYYALLFLLSVAQTIAFVRLMSKQSLARASLWTGVSTLAVLTHYYAAVPAAVQGIYYLLKFRERALRTWPAMILTWPAFAWFAFHLPRLRLYAEPGISWYQKLSWSEAARFSVWPLGGDFVIGGGILLLALLFRERKTVPDGVAALIVTSAASVLILLVAGMSLPMFTQRYLIPLAPACLYGVAAVARPIAFLPTAVLLFVPMSNWQLQRQDLEQRSDFGLEKPARLVPSGSTVTWMIDYGASRIHERDQMEEMLRDAFRRNGKAVNARWATDFESGDALILIYQDATGRTLPLPRWPCRSVDAWGHTTIVCLKDGRWTQ